jgi:hypothetical protein
MRKLRELVAQADSLRPGRLRLAHPNGWPAVTAAPRQPITGSPEKVSQIAARFPHCNYDPGSYLTQLSPYPDGYHLSGGARDRCCFGSKGVAWESASVL